MPTRGARGTSASFAVAVARRSTTTSFGGFGPRRRSRMHDPEHSLLRGDVVTDVEDGVGRVEVGIRAGLAVRAEVSFRAAAAVAV